LIWWIFNETQTKVIHNSRQYEQLSNNTFFSVTELTVVTDFSYFILLKKIQLHDVVLLISSVRFIENRTEVTKRNCSLTFWSTKFIRIIYKYSALMSQATHLISITETNLLILFRDMITVSSENHTKKHIYILWGKRRAFNYKAGGVYSNHCALRSTGRNIEHMSLTLFSSNPVNQMESCIVITYHLTLNTIHT
jgi:hypothetical protein